MTRDMSGRALPPGRDVAIAALVTALMTGPITTLRTLWPDGAWDLLTGVVVAIALEASLTTRWLRGNRQAGNPFLYRLAELVVILIVLRLITWLAWGNLPDLPALRELLLNPLAILDLPFVTTAFMALLAWDRSISFSTVFVTLDPSPSENALIRGGPGGRRPAPSAWVTRDRPALLRQFHRSWITWGAILAFFTALTTLDLPVRRFASGGTVDLRTVGRLGLQPQMLLALMVYFIGGLWLASQGRMAVMRARWLVEGVNVDPSLVRRWRRQSLLLLFIVAGAAAFLPIGSTAAIGAILEIAANLLLFMAWLVPGLILYLLSLVLPDNAAEMVEPLSTPFAPLNLSPSGGSAAPPNETAELIIGSVFWFISGVIAVAATLFFLRGRGLTVSWPLDLWAAIRVWLASLWRGVEEGAGALAHALRSRMSSPGPGIGLVRPPWRYIRFNALAPRDQIRFLYLAAVRRAGEGGVSRDEAETPQEYLVDLKSAWPTSEGDLDDLTGAFLVARYSRREIFEDDAVAIKRIWRRLRRALRAGGAEREDEET